MVVTEKSAVTRQRAASSSIGRLDWLRVGIAVAAVGWGANQFAPMLLVYRARLGLSDATVQATFGFYALGLIPGLLVFGALADRVGRRRVMLPALTMSIAASALLIAGGHISGLLFVGRFVAGLASGAAFSSGAAWIKELSVGAGADEGTGPRRVTVTMTAGFGAGPLVAGLLAQWAPAPTTVPYLPHLVLLVVAFAVTARAPETRVPESDRPRAALVSVAELRNPRFRAVVLPLAPWVFGSAAIALAYLPGLVEGAVGHEALAFTAVVTMLAALAGILIQPVARRISATGRTALVASSLAMVTAGLVMAAVAAAQNSPVLVVVAVLILGAGYGACQVCGLQEIARLARPECRAGFTSVYQAVSYLGFALPFILAALAGPRSAATLLIAVAVLAAGTLIWTSAAAIRTERRS
jgi:MFS family permease